MNKNFFWQIRWHLQMQYITLLNNFQVETGVKYDVTCFFQAITSSGSLGFVCHGDRGIVVWNARDFRYLCQSSGANDCPLPSATRTNLYYDFCLLGSLDGFWEIHQNLLYMPIEDDEDYNRSQTQVSQTLSFRIDNEIGTWKSL